ncbi:MAG: bifunctional adenosylcobinamide kinase/adenosylcobinamide-phosphate guanylyltransferase [Desertifilum sp.]|nr:bifunctional adenosylcobinamide kinase/adenosylcobinamide-phosphate guanylyltransferase [Desertifilum sp.]
MGQIILVTGPARSGKSEWAESLAQQTGKSVVYVATATLDPQDREWQQRIAAHQQRRPASWQTLEVSAELAATLRVTPASDCLLVDSLGTWLANFLPEEESQWQAIQAELLESLAQTEADSIWVAEETGWGVVPAYPMGRLFRDRLGNLVRRLSAIAHRVDLVTGGYVLNLSQLGTPLPLWQQSDRSTQSG